MQSADWKVCAIFLQVSLGIKSIISVMCVEQMMYLKMMDKILISHDV